MSKRQTQAAQSPEGASRFLPEAELRFDYGFTDRAWRAFIEASGLEVFAVPGGVRLVDRTAFLAAVDKLAIPLSLYAPPAQPESIRTTPQQDPSPTAGRRV